MRDGKNKIESDEDICCPLCKSRLQYGFEEVVLHLKVIDLKTGELQKRIKKRRVMNPDLRGFLYCENDLCEFFANDEDKGLYGQYFYLFKKICKINKGDIVAFEKMVKAVGSA